MRSSAANEAHTTTQLSWSALSPDILGAVFSFFSVQELGQIFSVCKVIPHKRTLRWEEHGQQHYVLL